MNRLEPLRFRPSLREKIWGTHDLRPVLGRAEHRIGEAWCLHDGSRVAEGPLRGQSVASLVERFGKRLMGAAWSPGDFGAPAANGGGPSAFPLCGKILFAAGRLSVQVHPDNELARRLEGCRGKTEIWYVLDARPGAELGLGLTADLGPAELAEAAADGSVEDLLRWVPAVPGRCALVPAGTVHSVRNGAVLCEIHQNSDLTYRLFDFRRRDLAGRYRTLQVRRATEAADTAARPELTAPRVVSGEPCRVAQLGRCRHFAAELLAWDRPFLYSPDPLRCQILVIVRGFGSVNAVQFEPGDAFVIPAESPRFPVAGDRAQAVRAYLP